MNSTEAYPLHWPPGRPRTKNRTRANFHRKGEESRPRGDGTSYTWKTKQKLTIGDSRDRVLAELGRLGGTHVVISSNLRLRGDGLPISSQREPDDPGIAVYFRFNRQPHCLSCDTWDRAADNLAAIAKHVEAMRGQLRWGVADIATMFAGFKALPGAIITPQALTPEEAREVILRMSGLPVGTSYDDAFRAAARKLHPDANGGQELPRWHELMRAAGVINESLK